MLSTNIFLSGNNFAKVALPFKYMNIGMVAKITFLPYKMSTMWIRSRTLGCKGEHLFFLV